MTPAFHTPLTKDELEKWRQEFWGRVYSYFLRHKSEWLEARLVDHQERYRSRSR